MSLEIPLLIREKLDYYLYSRVWKKHIECVNLEYRASLYKYPNNSVMNTAQGIYINLRGYWKWFTYRYPRSDTYILRGVTADCYIYDIRGRDIGKLPKHYHYIL